MWLTLFRDFQLTPLNFPPNGYRCRLLPGKKFQMRISMEQLAESIP